MTGQNVRAHVTGKLGALLATAVLVAACAPDQSNPPADADTVTTVSPSAEATSEEAALHEGSAPTSIPEMAASASTTETAASSSTTLPAAPPEMTEEIGELEELEELLEELDDLLAGL